MIRILYRIQFRLPAQGQLSVELRASIAIPTGIHVRTVQFIG